MSNLSTKILFVISLFAYSAGISFGQKSDMEMAKKYFQLFGEYEYLDTLKARIYADSGLVFALKTRDNETIGRAHQFIGWRYQDRSRARDANKEFYKALAYFKKSGKEQGIADAYGNLGNSYLDLNEYQKSLDYQHLSLKANEDIIASKPNKEALGSAKEGKSYALHNIAAIYQDIGLYDKALEYEHKSIKHEIEVNNNVGAAISYNSLASINKSLNHVDSAILYYKKALEIYKNYDYPDGLAGSLHGFAMLKNSKLSHSKRKEMIEKALQIRVDLGDVDGEARLLLDIAEEEFKSLSKDSLSVLLERIYNSIIDNDLNLLNEKYFRIYSKYNSKIGKYDSAYFALENFLELKAISDEKKRTNDLVASDIKFRLQTKNYNDSLTIVNGFAMERAAHNEELAKIQNIVYLSVIGFIFLIAFLSYLINSNRRRKKVNSMLSDKNDLIQEQKAIVDEKNKAISDSINYAKRLQNAILPTAAVVNEYLPESFLFFKPKDVVSGDFHWFETNESWFYIAAADCTGHGVPGAMVSVVCSNALNRAVNEFKLLQPNEILDKTRELVIETFSKSERNVDDGMDIALCAIDPKQGKLIFSGANNPLWLVRKKENTAEDCADNVLESDSHTLYEFKGNKQPIGLYGNLLPFTNREILLMKGDVIYLFTDGFPDQFGGENGKKFMYKPFKRELLKICALDLSLQKTHIENLFTEWKQDLEQVDDVCVIGFKVI